MDVSKERMHILEMIDSGKISAEDGLMLLQALNGADEADIDDEAEGLPDPLGDNASYSASLPLDEPAMPAAPFPPAAPAAPFAQDAVMPPPVPTPPPALGTAGIAAQPLPPMPAPLPPAAPAPEPEYRAPSDAGQPQRGAAQAEVLPSQEETAQGLPASALKWKRWWMAPLWVGVVVTIWGGLFMYWSASAAKGLSIWFLCASVPFILGVALMAIAFQSRTAPWLHLRVRQKPGEKPQNIAFSMPLPIGPARWFFQTFGGRIKGMENVQMDEVLNAVGRSATADTPIYIQADEGEDGEKVEIYIG